MTDVFAAVKKEGHEKVVFGSDARTGLKAIVAIHSTARGPALGGTRFHPYPTEEAALADVLDLARAMTLKSAAAELPLGGGKAVIIGDPAQSKTEALLEEYGRFVDKLSGTYLTAEDVGTTVRDMQIVRRTTRHVTGLPIGEGGSGDPSPATAVGVIAAMRAVSEWLWGNSDLGARHVAVQGVGKVGSALVGLLVGSGARVTVGDVDQAAVMAIAGEAAVDVVPADDILFTPCDILAPCALGGVLNAETIPMLRCQAVVGAANNQLASGADAVALDARSVLYAPDFVVNAGGIINISEELNEYDEHRARARVDRIQDATEAILRVAKDRHLNPHEAAMMYAGARLRGPS